MRFDLEVEAESRRAFQRELASPVDCRFNQNPVAWTMLFVIVLLWSIMGSVMVIKATWL